MRQATAKLEQALVCNKCKTKANFVEEHCGPSFSPGEEWLISWCPSSICREKPWFFCKSCHSRSYQNGLAKHAASKKHQTNSQAQQEKPPSPSPSPMHQGGPKVPTSSTCEDVEMQEPNEFATTSMDIDLCQPTTTACYVPKLKMDGNEWLDKVFANTRKACNKGWSNSCIRNTQNWSTWIFHLSELASGKNKCGRGLMYLAGRAFQQAKDSQLAENSCFGFGPLWRFIAVVSWGAQLLLTFMWRWYKATTTPCAAPATMDAYIPWANPWLCHPRNERQDYQWYWQTWKFILNDWTVQISFFFV
jgi:hypothetical protein